MFRVDSKLLPVCRIARAKCCNLGRSDFVMHQVLGIVHLKLVSFWGTSCIRYAVSGLIHSYDMSKANVHDMHYLQDIKHEYSCLTVIGDRFE